MYAAQNLQSSSQYFESKTSTEMSGYMPKVTEKDQMRMLRLYHESCRRTDSKVKSANRFYQETMIKMLKNMDPIIVRNGMEWRRYTFKDAAISCPTSIRSDGSCERTVPLHCLKQNTGYLGDYFAFIQEDIFVMKCQDGSVQFDTRQMQQDKRRAAIEAASNEGITPLNLVAQCNDNMVDESQSNSVCSNNQTTVMTELKSISVQSNLLQDGHNSTPVSASSLYGNPDDYPTPVNCLSNNELCDRYGTLVQSQVYNYVKLFDLHILTKSILDNMNEGLGSEYGECLLDDGGYFITDRGVEKILMFRHSLVPNIVIKSYKRVEKGRSYSYKVECRSEHVNENRSSSTFYMMFVQEKLLSFDVETNKINEIGYARCELSKILQNIPVVMWIRALGVNSDDEVRRMFISTCGGRHACTSFQLRCLERCILDNQGCVTTLQAILRIGKTAGGKTQSEQWFMGRTKLRKELLPHIGKSKSEPEFQSQCRKKARFLCHMLHELLLTVEYASKMESGVSKKKNPFLTDRDCYFTRQFQTIEELLSPLLQQYIKPHLNKFIPTNILKRLDHGQDVNPYEAFYIAKINKNVNYNIAMGVWHATPGLKSQTGVSQNIARHNYLDMLSQHDKVMNPMHKEGKQIEPRLLPSTAFGIVDAVDTPEGESAGLHRQRAMFVHQTLWTNPDIIVKFLIEDEYLRSDDELDGGVLGSSVGSVNIGTNSHTHHIVLDNKNNNKPVSHKSKLNWRNANNSNEENNNNNQHSSELLNDNGNAAFWHVYANEIPCGYTDKPDKLLQRIRHMRRCGMISQETSCSYALFSDPWDIKFGSIAQAQTKEPYGDIIGFDDDHPELLKSARWNDRSKALCAYKINIRTGSGRNVRELFSVENLWKLDYINLEKCTHGELLQEGIVEYLDVEETRDCLIAESVEELNASFQKWNEFVQKHQLRGDDAIYPASKRTNTFSHMEIHPSVVFGICAGLIPFAQHNPGARNAFQTHMMKHAQGRASTNSKTHRLDTSFNESLSAERRLVSTEIDESLGCFRLATSTVQKVAFYSTDNEDDSLLVNASSTEASYMASSIYKTITVSERKHKTKIEQIGRFALDNMTAVKIGCDYSQLDERGIIKKGSVIGPRSVLVQRSINGQDSSVVHKGSQAAVIDEVETFRNENHLLVTKIRHREFRPFCQGDKGASFHGQKGTIDGIVRRENMIFDCELNEFPDVVYNPSCIQNRMTYAWLQELLLSVICAKTGRFADGTPLSKAYKASIWDLLQKAKERAKANNYTPSFTLPSIPIDDCGGTIEREILDDIGLVLKELNLHPQSSHSYIDFRTGKRVAGTLIFDGRCAWSKLKQMSIDKIRARGVGRICYSTRQATEGRSQDGGLKFGEMEVSCCSGYGGDQIVNDKLLISSDPTYEHICTICSNKAIYHERLNMTYCLNCNRKNTSTNNFGSGSLAVFGNELNSMGVRMKLHSHME